MPRGLWDSRAGRCAVNRLGVEERWRRQIWEVHDLCISLHSFKGWGLIGRGPINGLLLGLGVSRLALKNIFGVSYLRKRPLPLSVRPGLSTGFLCFWR